MLRLPVSVARRLPASGRSTVLLRAGGVSTQQRRSFAGGDEGDWSKDGFSTKWKDPNPLPWHAVMGETYNINKRWMPARALDNWDPKDPWDANVGDKRYQWFFDWFDQAFDMLPSFVAPEAGTRRREPTRAEHYAASPESFIPPPSIYSGKEGELVAGGPREPSYLKKVIKQYGWIPMAAMASSLVFQFELIWWHEWLYTPITATAALFVFHNYLVPQASIPDLREHLQVEHRFYMRALDLKVVGNKYFADNIAPSADPRLQLESSVVSLGAVSGVLPVYKELQDRVELAEKYETKLQELYDSERAETASQSKRAMANWKSNIHSYIKQEKFQRKWFDDMLEVLDKAEPGEKVELNWEPVIEQAEKCWEDSVSGKKK